MCVEEAITALKQEIYFIVFTFCDNSKFVVCTTLDADILEAFKVVFIKDCFYDLRRQRYVKFRYDAVSVDVYREEPAMSEVDKFANRFI